MHFPTACALALLSLGGLGFAQEGPITGPGSLFVERPGQLEFSGLMIVRPLPDETRHERAVSRLHKQVVEFVAPTDEYIVAVPPHHDENSYAHWLMQTGDYEYAEPDWICFPTLQTPNDASYWQQWHHDQIRSPLAWGIETGDSSVIVAIVDGGMQLDHPDLVGTLVSGYNSDDDLTQSLGGEVTDVDGHGTFVSGLAGATGNNGAFVAGVGWDLSMMPVRYYNQPGGGYLHNITEGARWAVENGAKCINVSQTGIEHSSVQTTGAYVKSLGGLLFWAAGNDQRDLSWFDWDDVIVVGGTDPADAKASFSAFGVAVDVYAPATDIYSTGLVSALAVGSGTSAATPIVSGLAALTWSLRPDLTPDQVEASLFQGCVDLGSPGEDPYWGHGRIDAYATLQAAGFASITANGQGTEAFVVRGANLTLEIQVEPGTLGAAPSEWWLVVRAPSRWRHFNQSQWALGILPMFQGPLYPLDPDTVLDWSGLPVGTHEFLFGVDTIINGTPDLNEMLLDSVIVTVL